MSEGAMTTLTGSEAAETPTVAKPRRVPLSLIIGGSVAGLFVLLALIGPYITPYPFDEFHFGSRLAPPSAEFWWGTDRYGRDIFSRVIAGARLTVFMAGTGTLVGVFFGILIGLFSGYVGGWFDEILMRLTDIAMSFPGLLLALLVVAALGANEVNAVISISIVFTPKVARVVRSATLGLRHVQFVEAARSIGAPTWRVLLLHVAPNTFAPVMVQATFVFATAILVEAGLSFLGLGIPPDLPSWGNILALGRTYLQTAVWVSFFPGLILTITVLAINLVGDGLRDALDPKLARRE